jgi:hypothetical protein
MGGIDPVQIADSISKLSPVGIAALLVLLFGVAFYRRWLVLGPYYEDLERRLTKTENQRDEALSLAAKLTDILEAGRRGSFRGR